MDLLLGCAPTLLPFLLMCALVNHDAVTAFSPSSKAAFCLLLCSPIIALFVPFLSPLPPSLRCNPYGAITNMLKAAAPITMMKDGCHKPIKKPMQSLSQREQFSGSTLIYGVHPHGPTLAPMQCLRLPLDPSIRIFVASGIYLLPLVNWLAFLHGQNVPATKARIMSRLNGGGSALLMPGGVLEDYLGTLQQRRDSSKIVISTKHEGFLRLAVEQGTKVVPCFAFGMDRQHSPFFSAWVDRMLYLVLGIRILLMFDRNGIIGRNIDEPITIISGQELNPSTFADVTALKAAYYTELKNIFERNKHRFEAYGEKSLVFVGNEESPLKIKWHGHAAPLVYIVVLIVAALWKGDFFWYASGILGSHVRYCREWFVHVHAISCSAMWALSALQFLFSKAGSRLHRICGYAYFVNIFLLVVPSSYWMAFHHHSPVLRAIPFASNMALTSEVAFHAFWGLVYVVSPSLRDIALHRKHLKWIMSATCTIVLVRILKTVEAYVFNRALAQYGYVLIQMVGIATASYWSWYYQHSPRAPAASVKCKPMKHFLPWWHILAMVPLYYSLHWMGIAPMDWAERADTH